jgi:hypothetical protein
MRDLMKGDSEQQGQDGNGRKLDRREILHR